MHTNRKRVNEALIIQPPVDGSRCQHEQKYCFFLPQQTIIEAKHYFLPLL